MNARRAVMVQVTKRLAFRYGATVEEVMGKCQRTNTREARDHAMRSLCLLGYTNIEIATFFNLHRSTVVYHLSTAPGMTRKRGVRFADAAE